MADEVPVPEPPEGDLKKERKVYKGDIKPITDLAALTVVQIIDREAHAGNAKLPSLAYIERIDPGYDKLSRRVVMLEPRNGFLRKTYHVKAEAKFNVLTGRLGDELRAETLAWQKKNLLANFTNHRFIGNIGTDPEVFVQDKDGEVIPSWYFLKDKASKTVGANSYYGASRVYWDGFQGEFDVPTGTCLAYIVDGIRAGLLGIHNAAKVFNGDSSLMPRTVVDAPEKVLETAQEKYVEFGCAPSLNVYGITGRNEPGRMVPYRFAGGHLHFGSGKLSPTTISQVVKAMDSMLAVTCVSLFADYDVPVRRQYYGLAGEYRLPPHGLEYRTLSNAWLFHPTMTNFVFDFARKVWGLGAAGLQTMWECKEDEWVRVVNEHDVDGARAILKTNEDVFVAMVNSLDGSYRGSGADAYKLVTLGCDSWVKDMKDIARNWRLDVKHGEWLAHNNVKGTNWYTSLATIRAGGKV